MKLLKKNLMLILFSSVLSANLSDNFINRWAFQEYAQHIFDMTNDLKSTRPGGSTFDPKKVKTGDVIFVRRVSLDAFFLYMHPEINAPYILITHVDDWPVPGPAVRLQHIGYLRYLKDPKLVAWFGINANIARHSKFVPIPIGVFQIKKFNDERVQYNKMFNDLKQMPKDKLLYMNFAVWTNPAERQYVKDLFGTKPYCLVGGEKSFENYMAEMAQCKYVLSPEGNGPDCYRTWEALLVGCIPIVTKSHLNPLFKDLPILVISKWKEINQEMLEAQYKQLTEKNYHFEKLYMEYWIEQIEAKRALCHTIQLSQKKTGRRKHKKRF